MTKFLLITICVSSLCAQFVDFVDPSFKSFCVDSFDIDMDGEISFNEALLVESFVAIDLGISDLSGIELFENLESLDVSDNQITSLAPLASLKNLRVINVLRNKIRVVPNFGLTSLIHFSAYGNEITVVNELPVSITFVGLAENKLRNLTPFLDLDNLERLIVTDNYIAEDDCPEIAFLNDHVSNFHYIFQYGFRILNHQCPSWPDMSILEFVDTGKYTFILHCPE